MGNSDTIKELTALITYLVNHNESHTKELEELGESLKKEGKLEAYNDVLTDLMEHKVSIRATLEKADLVENNQSLGSLTW